MEILIKNNKAIEIIDKEQNYTVVKIISTKRNESRYIISNNDFKNDGPYNISESEINKMFKININQLFEKYNINSDELSLNKQEIHLITNIIEDKIINFQSVLNRTNKENWNNEIEKLNKLKLKINNYAI